MEEVGMGDITNLRKATKDDGPAGVWFVVPSGDQFPDFYYFRI
jgi:hypothetical protein